MQKSSSIPLLIFFFFLLFMGLAFFAFIMKLINKAKKGSWSGTLIDKIHQTGEDIDSGEETNFYSLVFQTDANKKVKLAVSKKLYDQFQIGNLAEKPNGKIWPRKIS